MVMSLFYKHGENKRMPSGWIYISSCTNYEEKGVSETDSRQSADYLSNFIPNYPEQNVAMRLLIWQFFNIPKGVIIWRWEWRWKTQLVKKI